MKIGIRHLVVTAVIATATPVLILCVARAAAPTDIAIEDVDSVLTVALAKPLHEFIGGGQAVVYIEGKEGIARLASLQNGYPAAQLKAWTERPDDGGCKSPDPRVVVIGPCQRNDFVSLSNVIFPLWRTALIQVGTFNGRGELIFVKITGQWRVLTEHWYVI